LSLYLRNVIKGWRN